MKTYIECIPCFYRQAIEAAKMAGVNEKKQKELIDSLSKSVLKFELSSSPPEMGRIIHRHIKRITREKDPYKRLKDISNKMALRLYKKIKKRVNSAQDKFVKAVELAIAGNIIDYGVKNSLDVESELDKMLSLEHDLVLKESKKIFDIDSFMKSIDKAHTVLYLADNAGETVFDRILIEEIKRRDREKRIIYAVKSKPIINDALKEDAYACGIHKSADIIASGSDAPGTILKLCTDCFIKIFNNADMVISKGQGNFETLSNCKRRIFYLFMAKCPIVAKDIGANLGDIILFSKNGR